MIAPNPTYLLFCNTRLLPQNEATRVAQNSLRGRWQFVLERLDRSSEKLEAVDTESVPSADRLNLLCVVRGLEALEQPSRVTLVTTSRYVNRGLRFGLTTWRESGYKWERFGVQKPVRNADLWKRVATALDFHDVNCRLLNTAVMVAGENAAENAAEVAPERISSGADSLIGELPTGMRPLGDRLEQVPEELDQELALAATVGTEMAGAPASSGRAGKALRESSSEMKVSALQALCRGTRSGFLAPALQQTKDRLKQISENVQMQPTTLVGA